LRSARCRQHALTSEVTNRPRSAELPHLHLVPPPFPLTGDAAAIAVDLRRLTFIDSTGIDLIIEAGKARPAPSPKPGACAWTGAESPAVRSDDRPGPRSLARTFSSAERRVMHNVNLAPRRAGLDEPARPQIRAAHARTAQLVVNTCCTVSLPPLAGARGPVIRGVGSRRSVSSSGASCEHRAS
jgi:hypothetical protein